jgi:hypothetical protein
MNDGHQRRLVFHGAIILLIGSLCGLPEMAVIRQGAPETAIHAWRVAHDALVLGGVMVIAIAAALRYVTLGASGMAWLTGSLLALAYGAVVGLGLPAFTGLRGLEPKGPPLNLVAFVGNLFVGAGTIVALSLLIWGARGSRRPG